MITQIDSISDVEDMEFSINTAELLKKDFAISELKKIVNVEIIGTIAEKMRTAGYSDKIIHSTYLKEITINGNDEAEIYIVSDYTTETAYSVSDAMEYGTKRNYPITPKDSTSDRPNPHLSFILNGVRLYSKKIIHPGQKGTHIIVDTIQQKSDVVTQKYYLKEQEWIHNLF